MCHFGEFCNITQLFEMSCESLRNPLIFCDKRDGEVFLSIDQAAWAQSRALVLKSRDSLVKIARHSLEALKF